jgi:hypothetical protein
MKRFPNIFILALLVLATLFAAEARAAELNPPQQAKAGEPLSIPTGGSGSATLYVVGPGVAFKRDVRLGEAAQLKAEELRHAGVYSIILKSSDGTEQKTLYVSAASPSKVNFLARPSRVPVAAQQAISGVAFVFDEYGNLVTQPTAVKFDLSVNGASTLAKTETARDGIAYLRTNSGAKAGAAQFVASAGSDSVRRVVQQVASEPCNLRLKIHRENQRLVAETEPIRDCSGNPVPDGTIVTFIESEPNGAGRSTVDARIKKGVARAELPAVAGATISVASGVVLGNEVRYGGGQ